MISCTDLILGKALSVFMFFYFPDSRLSVLNGLHSYFHGVTVKTENVIISKKALGLFQVTYQSPISTDPSPNSKDNAVTLEAVCACKGKTKGIEFLVTITYQNVASHLIFKIT